MYKYFVVARPPVKKNLSWDYAPNYFPRAVYYKSDANKIEASAKRKGGESVRVKDYCSSEFEAAKRFCQGK